MLQPASEIGAPPFEGVGVVLLPLLPPTHFWLVTCPPSANSLSACISLNSYDFYSPTYSSSS